MQSPLLRLPGELRNMIYEYVLTEDTRRIYYREDGQGIGWLCLLQGSGNVTEAKETSSSAAQKTYDAHGPNRKRHKLTKNDRAGGKRTVDELGIEGTAMVKVNGHNVANQIQFANRQLRSETKALGIRYNDVYFVDSAQHLRTFLASISGYKRHWVQRLVVRAVDTLWLDLPQLFAGLNIMGRVPPEVPIHLHWPGAHIDDDTFFYTALILNYIGRNNTAFVRRLMGSPNEQQFMVDLVEETRGSLGDELRLLPAHIRVFPWDEVFDEPALRKPCEENYLTKLFVSSLPGGMEDLVVVAKEWFENGI